MGLDCYEKDQYGESFYFHTSSTNDNIDSGSLSTGGRKIYFASHISQETATQSDFFVKVYLV